MTPVIQEFNAQIQSRFEQMIRDLKMQRGDFRGRKRNLVARYGIEAICEGCNIPSRDTLEAASGAIGQALMGMLVAPAKSATSTGLESRMVDRLLADTLRDLRNSAFDGAYGAAGEETRIGGYTLREPTENLDELMDSGFRKIGPEGYALVSPALSWWLMGGRDVTDDGPKLGGCPAAEWRGRQVVVNPQAGSDHPVLFLKPGWATAGGDIFAGIDLSDIDPDPATVTVPLITEVAFEIDSDNILSITVQDLF